MLVRNGTHDVLVVAVGSMAEVAVDVAERLAAQGIGVTVVDPRWVKPVDPAIVELAREHRLVVSIEDNGRIGGCGAVLLQTLNDAGVTTPYRLHGIPQEFLDHAKRDVDPRARRPDRADDRPRHRGGRDRRRATGAPWSMPTRRDPPERVTARSAAVVLPVMVHAAQSLPRARAAGRRPADGVDDRGLRRRSTGETGPTPVRRWPRGSPPP